MNWMLTFFIIILIKLSPFFHKVALGLGIRIRYGNKYWQLVTMPVADAALRSTEQQ